MHKHWLSGLLIIFFCFNNSSATIPKERQYESVKTSVQAGRKFFKKQYDAAKTADDKKKVLTSAGNYLSTILVDTIFPYWYGTPWDFNGYTNTPGEGIIACGYFVSTPLKHCGFNLNRYKLAQKYSLAIVNTLSCGDEVIKYQGITAERFLQKTRMVVKNGLYVVGLDNHVGYLLYEGDQIWFIHSSYFDPGAVVKENASESAALKTSRTFVMCNLTGNEKLLTKWLNAEIIAID